MSDMYAEGITCPYCGTKLNRSCSRTPFDKKGDVIITMNQCERKDGSGCKRPVRVEFMIIDEENYEYKLVKED